MKESEIRPKEVFDRYIELSKADGEKLDQKEFCQIDCCACGSTKTENHFDKNSYSYKMCKECGSLFCSPRPSLQQLSNMYFGSESSTYWSNVFFPSVEAVRREKMFRPKAEKVANLVKDKNLNIKNICDVGAGHGIFLEELKNFSEGLELFALEPDETSANKCKEKGIQVLQKVSEEANDWHGKFDMVMSSEVIEHVFSPKIFIQSLYDLIQPEGYCLVTGLGYEGFDVLTLQAESKSVSAPHHLNFMSVDGFESLFKSVGFKEVEIWTPGVLDVDITMNSGFESEFLRVLKKRGPEAVKKFQSFLSESKLSSHIWILAKK